MRIEIGPSFATAAKRLRKKYTSFTNDYAHLLEEIAENPGVGVSIGKSCRKIRMAISSKGKGKSGGARVIAYVAIIEDRAVLLTIYDKSERENLSQEELTGLLKEIGQ